MVYSWQTEKYPGPSERKAQPQQDTRSDITDVVEDSPGHMVVKEERIAQLQQELAQLQTNEVAVQPQGGMDFNGIMGAIARNPEQLLNKFQMDEQRARQLKGVISGLSAGFAVRYLGKSIGDQWAGALGGLLGGLASKKLLG